MTARRRAVREILRESHPVDVQSPGLLHDPGEPARAPEQGRRPGAECIPAALRPSCGTQGVSERRHCACSGTSVVAHRLNSDSARRSATVNGAPAERRARAMRASTAQRQGRQRSRTATRSTIATTANCGSVRLHIPHSTCRHTSRTPPSHTWADPSSWSASSVPPHPGQRLSDRESTESTSSRPSVLIEKHLDSDHVLGKFERTNAATGRSSWSCHRGSRMSGA